MGTCAYAHLVYGYDLGTSDDLPDLPWLDEDDDDFADQAMERIKAAGITGVGFQFAGHYDYSGYVLCAEGSERSAAWAETMELDPALLAAPQPEWDARLNAAAVVLDGLTDLTSDGPRWLVFASYG